MANNKNIFIVIIIIGIFIAIQNNQNIQAIFDPKTEIFRPLFDNPNDFSLDKDDFFGTIELSIGVNLSAVESMRYIIRACGEEPGNNRVLKLNGIKYGTTGFNTCKKLFFDDFQHYDEKIIQKETLGTLAITSNAIEWDVEDTGVLTIQEHRLSFNEKVGCTRSSQCPVILIAGESIQATCSQVYHKCEITKFNRFIREDDIITKQPEEKPGKPTNLMSVIVGVIIIGLIIYLIRRRHG